MGCIISKLFWIFFICFIFTRPLNTDSQRSQLAQRLKLQDSKLENISELAQLSIQVSQLAIAYTAVYVSTSCRCLTLNWSATHTCS